MRNLCIKWTKLFILKAKQRKQESEHSCPSQQTIVSLKIFMNLHVCTSLEASLTLHLIFKLT